MQTLKRVLIAVAILLSAWAASAEKKAQGFLIVADGTKVFKKSKGDAVVTTLNKGDAVVGLTTGGLGEKVPEATSNGWIGQEVDGRRHIEYVDDYQMERPGWLDPATALAFNYECGCGPEKESCSPFVMFGFFKAKWNPCFEEGRDAKKVSSAPDSPKGEQTVVKPSVEDRLKKLEELLKKGLVTRSEYDKKRADILKEM